MPVFDLSARFVQVVPAPRRLRLAQAGALAAERGWPVYLIGGCVRDLGLGVPPDDFDLVVEGEAPALARALAARWGGAVTVHAAFGTAAWTTPDGLGVDLATARTETYPRPAALPVVRGPVPLRADVDRRDFTLNTLAAAVQGEALGPLIDYRAGQADLAARLIRALHPRSFEDDPTRLFRAVRYEQRLGGQIEPETLSWMAGAGAALAALSGDRLRHELERIWAEPRAADMLARLDALGILRGAHPALVWGPAESEAAQLIPGLPWPAWGMPPAPDAVWLTLLLRTADPAARQAALEYLNPTRAVAAAVAEAGDLRGPWARPSAAVAELDGRSLAGLAAAYVVWPALRADLDAYLKDWRHVQAATTGDDLIRRGLQPGPQFRVWLGRLRAARLDGQAAEAAGESALLDRWLNGQE